MMTLAQFIILAEESGLVLSSGGGGGGTGDMVGPSYSTQNAMSRFADSAGKIIKDGVIVADDDGNINNVGANPVRFIFGSDFFWVGDENASYGYSFVAGLGAHTVNVGVGNILLGHYSTSNKNGCFVFSDSTTTSGDNHYPAADNQAIFYAAGGFGIGVANNSPQAGFHYGHSFGNDGNFLFSAQGPVTTSSMASKEVNPYVDTETFKIKYKGASGTEYNIILPSGTAATLSADNVMTGKNKFASLTTTGSFYDFKSPIAINASRTLSAADILSRHLYAISSTAAPITLSFGTASSLLSAMNAISAPIVGSPIPLRIFNGSNFPLTINVTDTVNFIILSLGSNVITVAPGSGIDLEFNLASISPDKFFLSGVSASAANRNIQVISNVSISKTIGYTDIGTLQLCSSAATQTIILPSDANLPGPIGDIVYFSQNGAGTINYVAGAGAFIVSQVGNTPKSFDLNTDQSAHRIQANTWKVGGAIKA